MPVAQWLILVMGLSTITPDSSGESDRYDDDLRANGVAPPAGYAGDALDGYDGVGGEIPSFGLEDGVGAEVAAATGNTAPRLANREHTPSTKLPVKCLNIFT